MSEKSPKPAGTPLPPASAAAAPAGKTEAAAAPVSVPAAPSAREQELLQELQYARAELANAMTRAREEQQRCALEGRRAALLGVLPVLDELRRVLTRAEPQQVEATFLQALRLVEAQAEQFLAREGVERIRTAGELFDPLYHEAVVRVETSAHPEAAIIEELKPGYLHRGTLLIPARVTVAAPPAPKKPKPAPAPAPEKKPAPESPKPEKK
jgi:molecular chaperone GrpE